MCENMTVMNFPVTHAYYCLNAGLQKLILFLMKY